MHGEIQQIGILLEQGSEPIDPIIVTFEYNCSDSDSEDYEFNLESDEEPDEDSKGDIYI